MSLGSSDMAGSALGTAFSLLLLASIIQGLKNVEVFYYEKMEAFVGQNVMLPCTVNTSTNLHIVGIEWSKDRHKNTKLVVYSPNHGVQAFRPNVTIRIENNSTGSHLELYEVTKWDSGVYICDLTTFPLGSIRRETVLEIKDDKITCNVNSTVEVHAGNNVTIQCTTLPDAQYRWTKNKKLVSENESLVLLRVTDAHTGVYILTVNTGYISLQKEFIISVLTATTSLRTDLLTVSPQSSVTEGGLIEPTDSSFTTSPTAGLSTVDTNATYTHISVTSSPATHTDPSHFNSTDDQMINPTHTFNTATFSDRSVSSTESTTLSYGSTVAWNDSKQHTVHSEANSSTSPVEFSTLGNITETSDNPGVTPTHGSGNVTVAMYEETDGGRSHLLVVLLLVPVLLLITVACFLYRRRVIKERMDLPPPFKPPPPPVKYVAARHREISTQPFPTSRCNSVDFQYNASFIEQ